MRKKNIMRLKKTGTKFFFYILRRLFKYLSPFIRLFEIKPIRKYASRQPEFPIVFIIGAPRSGSTILYQLITNFFDVSYINNLIHLSRENLFFGFWFSNLLYKNKKHNNFQSNYGNTNKFGLNAPSEGGPIWYKWFSKEEIYFEKDSLSDKKVKQIRKHFYAIINKQQKPLIIKNLMFCQRLQVLKQIFPEAKIIIIKRDPLYLAQSLYIGRTKTNKNQLNEWWSIKPKNYYSLKNLNVFSQIAGQVYYIEKQISDDIKLFPQENIFKINYEDLNQLTEKDLLNISYFLEIGKPLSKLSDFLESITKDNKIQLDNNTFNKLQEEIDKYNWNKI